MVSEYCAGGDLQSLLDQDGYLPESAIKVIAVLWHGLRIRSDIFSSLLRCLSVCLFVYLGVRC